MDPLQCMTHNLIVVEAIYSRRGCKQCEIPITHGEHGVRSKQGVFHLQCYQPSRDYPINLSAVANSDKVPKEVKEWVWRQNQRFVLRRKFPARVQFDVQVNPRLLLQCFAFLDSVSVLRAEQVCRVWYVVCSKRELWDGLRERDFPTVTMQARSAVSAKEMYFYIEDRSCYNCRELKSCELCPLLRKPLCKACRLSMDFQLVTKSEIMTDLGVDASWLARRRLKFVPTMGRSLATYQWMLMRELEALQCGLKYRILQHFAQDKELINRIERGEPRGESEVCEKLASVVEKYIDRGDDSRKAYLAVIAELQTVRVLHSKEH